MASLEPKLLCGVTMSGSPWLRTRQGVTLSNRVRASFYATIMSNGWMTDIQPGNASAPTEPVAALHSVEIRPESETGNYTGGGYSCQAQAPHGKDLE